MIPKQKKSLEILSVLLYVVPELKENDPERQVHNVQYRMFKIYDQIVQFY